MFDQNDKKKLSQNISNSANDDANSMLKLVKGGEDIQKETVIIMKIF